jgi:hypothetical protein
VNRLGRLRFQPTIHFQLEHTLCVKHRFSLSPYPHFPYNIKDIIIRLKLGRVPLIAVNGS